MSKIYKKNGFLIKTFQSKELVKKLRKIVKKHFNKNENYYINLPRKKFSKIALKCQEEINKSNFIEKFHLTEKKTIKELVKNEIPLYSNSGYLRVVRPKSKQKINSSENLGWHRETFYSKRKFIKSATNIWLPILNTRKENMLQYIPNSHKIPDKKIIRRRVRVKDYKIKKNSAEHKLGYVYAPKKIKKGVNLNKKTKFVLKTNQYVAFSAMLIHGNGENNTNKIRFAYNFGLLAKNKLKNQSRRLDSRNHEYIEF